MKTNEPFDVIKLCCKLFSSSAVCKESKLKQSQKLSHTELFLKFTKKQLNYRISKQRKIKQLMRKSILTAKPRILPAVIMLLAYSATWNQSKHINKVCNFWTS